MKTEDSNNNSVYNTAASGKKVYVERPLQTVHVGANKKKKDEGSGTNSKLDDVQGVVQNHFQELKT